MVPCFVFVVAAGGLGVYADAAGEGPEYVQRLRILFLGADTPIATLRRAVETTDARLVVVASMDSALLEAQSAELRRLGRSAPLVLSGAGASEDLCTRLRVDRLDGDLVAAAGDVSRSVQAVRAP